MLQEIHNKMHKTFWSGSSSNQSKSLMIKQSTLIRHFKNTRDSFKKHFKSHKFTNSHTKKSPATLLASLKDHIQELKINETVDDEVRKDVRLLEDTLLVGYGLLVKETPPKSLNDPKEGTVISRDYETKVEDSGIDLNNALDELQLERGM